MTAFLKAAEGVSTSLDCPEKSPRVWTSPGIQISLCLNNCNVKVTSSVETVMSLFLQSLQATLNGGVLQSTKVSSGQRLRAWSRHAAWSWPCDGVLPEVSPFRLFLKIQPSNLFSVGEPSHPTAEMAGLGGGTPQKNFRQFHQLLPLKKPNINPLHVASF